MSTEHAPPIDPQRAVDAMIRCAPLYAKAKSERVYLEEFRKSKKALLMQAAPGIAIAAQEREAYAHPEYMELLCALRDAVEKEEAMRWTMVAAQARIEVWRSQEATNRNIERSTT